MNKDDEALLEELKSSLKEKSYKTFVEAYLKDPTAEALIKTTLVDLQRAINETD